MEVLFGILIPFIGTALGSACVFFMKRSLGDLVQRSLAGFAAGVMVATPLGKRCYEGMNARLGQGALALIDCGGLLCVLTMSMAYLVSGSYNPFLYFRF